MKTELRFLPLLFGLALAACNLSLAGAQDCPCPGAAPSWFGDADGWGEVPSGEFGAPGRVGNNMAACTTGFCPSSCRAEGIVFSTEVTLVDVWQSNNSDIAARLLALNGGGQINNLSPDADPSPLITFGYTTCEGLGFQGRFFEYDSAATVTAGPNLVKHAWDVMVFDMEVTYSSIYGAGWDIMLSGGYRFVDYEEGASVTNAAVSSVTSRYVGNGVTGGVALRRQINRNFSLMATPRFSFLLGGETVTSNVALPVQPLGNSFDIRYIVESKIGFNYETPNCGGGVWFARAGYEVQYWNDFVPAIDNQPRADSTILSGFFFALGLQR